LHALLVKVDLRAARIVGLSVQVQHIHHTRNKLCPTAGIHHCLYCQGFRTFFLTAAQPPNTLMGELATESQFHRPISQ
jgi:hypothetical protein